jgi:protease II
MKASTPSFSMSQSKRKALFEEELKKDLPDKFYNTNIDLTKRSNNGFKIPKSLSYKDPQPSEIGPGYYNSESDFLPNKKMKFSKQRRSSFID